METSINSQEIPVQSSKLAKQAFSNVSQHDSQASRAELQPKTSPDAENLLLFNSLSVKQFPLGLNNQTKPYNSFTMKDAFGLIFLENGAVQDLTFFRGRSQSYDYFEDEQYPRNLRLFSFKEQPINQLSVQVARPRETGEHESDPSYLSQLFMEQEFKSKERISDFSKSFTESERGESSGNVQGLKVTKNVTKNIGKLLFKFIWKNRKTLCRDLKIQASRWESFMSVISGWKKQNNITRQYLINKWHGNGQDSTLFRIISRHFFRKRCLTDIMKSHIRLKRVHYERIARFSMAVQDPSAIDYIA